MTALYFNPAEYPGKWVARRFTITPIGDPEPDDECQVFDLKPSPREVSGVDRNSAWLDRCEGDDPAIVGVWI